MRIIGVCVSVMAASQFLMGCASVPSGEVDRSRVAMAAVDYRERPVLTTSLFKSDQEVLSEDALAKIMTSKVNLPSKAKIAVIRFTQDEGGALRYYGSYYWRTEAYLKTQQEYLDALEKRLAGSDRVVQVVIVPSLLTPKEATISLLREAAVRLQADLLLVFRITSDTYYKHNWLQSDDVKAYSTCEAVLLDVRTGTIPFTAIVTSEKLDKKQKGDLETSEAMRRAEKLAVLDSLTEIGDRLSAFLKAVP